MRGKLEIVSDQLDFEIVLVGAVRYALGRRTYVVSSTVNMVENNLDLIQKKTAEVILRDIKECSDLGDQTDEDNWRRLQATLEELL